MKKLGGDVIYFIHNFLNFFRSIYTGIKNLIIWFPIIWKDRNYDYFYILYIIRHKLYIMKEYIDHPDVRRKLNYLLILLDKMIEDDFCKEEFEENDKKWGELKINFLPIDRSDGLQEIVFYRDKAATPELMLQERAEYTEITEKEEKLREECYKKFFDYFHKNINKLWY